MPCKEVTINKHELQFSMPCKQIEINISKRRLYLVNILTINVCKHLIENVTRNPA